MSETNTTHPRLVGVLSKVGGMSGQLSVPKSRIVAESYNNLYDKPVLNRVTIEGSKTSEDYHLQGKMEILTEQDIDEIIFGGN